MKYQIIIEKKAEKFIRKQGKKTQERLIKAICRLPDGTDIKKLRGQEMYRMRVGNYRVLYTVDDGIKVITVENIDNRGDVYKRF
ncbi:MAG TPA: type II toxin-antitoxin system RelE/ParE family toxin [Candidatus Blautia faecipullorum]|nr:type II toxin-antitoxin system RelE/ParE family toxin [Candidatus Blautia faecipullorum]